VSSGVGDVRGIICTVTRGCGRCRRERSSNGRPPHSLGAQLPRLPCLQPKWLAGGLWRTPDYRLISRELITLEIDALGVEAWNSKEGSRRVQWLLVAGPPLDCHLHLGRLHRGRIHIKAWLSLWLCSKQHEACSKQPISKHESGVIREGCWSRS
jgi:hypothetical protein